jgi:GAF domain-containing protein
MSSAAESVATLHGAEITLIADAMAALDARKAVLSAVEHIAAARMGVTVFSATTCFLETMELERVYSSRPDVYPTGGRKSKRETSWGQQVMRDRQVFVGEGPLEMAAAFDDQERMASVGIRSIINVPIVVRDRCLAVLNFGRSAERVLPGEVVLARFLGLVATAVFVTGQATTDTAG